MAHSLLRAHTHWHTRRPSHSTQATFTAGQVILSDRERGELFYIIKEGAVAVRGSPGAAAADRTAATGGSQSGGGGRLAAGEFFGECALLASTPGGAAAKKAGCDAAGGAEYVADSARVVVLAMRRAEFERLLGPYEELWR